MKSLRLKQDKWNKLIISDEQRSIITNFVEKGSCPENSLINIDKAESKSKVQALPKIPMSQIQKGKSNVDCCKNLKVHHQTILPLILYENYNIALAMSSSRADPVLGHCTGWGYLNIYISVTALAGGI